MQNFTHPDIVPAYGTLRNPHLYLHTGGRYGTVITSNDEDGSNSLIIRTLQPGTYTVEATNFFSTEYGTFQLSVQ